MAEEIRIARLGKDNITASSLDDFVRTQPVTHVWRRDSGGDYHLVEHPFTDDWSLPMKREKALDLIAPDMLSFGVFLEGRLIAFISLKATLAEERLIVDNLQVSRPFRRQGIGRILWKQGLETAQELGARELYISACSSRETIAFYRAMGADLTNHPIKEMAEEEPFDLQLSANVP